MNRSFPTNPIKGIPMLKRSILGIMILITSSMIVACNQQNDDGMLSQDAYLGQKFPGSTPEIFGPGIVSTDVGELNIIISPKGNEIYFSRKQPDGSMAIMVIEKSETNWNDPRIASFSGQFNDMDPSMTQDAMRIFFGSTRPSGMEKKEGCDIWVVERTSEGTWSAPTRLEEPVNTPMNENYPMVTQSETLYFLSNGHRGYGKLDIFRSEWRDGRYAMPENLGNSVNSEYNDFDPYVLPDESTLIFSSSDRPDGFGSGDLYISFRKSDGMWTKAVNMGPEVNSSAIEYCPKCSPDGKLLFFTSGRRGNDDIYWMDAGIIETIRAGINDEEKE